MRSWHFADNSFVHVVHSALLCPSLLPDRDCALCPASCPPITQPSISAAATRARTCGIIFLLVTSCIVYPECVANIMVVEVPEAHGQMHHIGALLEPRMHAPKSGGLATYCSRDASILTCSGARRQARYRRKNSCSSTVGHPASSKMLKLRFC